MKERRQADHAADRYNAWSFGASVLGWGALLLGQRVLAAGGAVKLFTGLAVLLLVGSFGQRVWSMLEATEDRRPAAQVMAFLSGLGLGALLLFAATSDWGRDKLGIAKPGFGEPDTLGEVGTVVWIGLLVISVLPSLLGELARWAMVRAEHFESRRVIAAIAAGLSVSFAVLYGSLFTFGTSFVDWSADFSYARVAKPSDSTLRMLESMEEPLEVRLYFPGHSEIGKKVEKYFDDLRAMGAQFEVQLTDRYLVPDQAKDDRVTRDGVVVLRRGEQSESLDIGVDEGRAVPKLKKFDGEFQKTLIKVIRDRRTVYLTVGHGELNESTDPKSGRTVRVLRELLQSQNYVLKNLGLKEGLANEVPDDASMVAVLGPTNPLTDAEVESLRRYAEAGGSLLLALDPDAKVDLSSLAAVAGLKWRQQLVINDRALVPVSRGPSDRKNLVVTRFSSHASVSTASKAVAQGYALVLLGASPLEALDPADKSYAIDYVFKSPPGSYVEETPNWSFDSDTEKKATYNLAAAVTRPLDPSEDAKQAASRPGGAEMRAFVVADADLFADRAMASSRLLSRLVLVEALRWLGGEESFSGEISSEEDVAIVHTKEEDALWFYGMILAIPSFVLGGGIAITRRRPKRKSGKKAATTEGPDEASPAGAETRTKPKRKKRRKKGPDAAAEEGAPTEGEATGDDPDAEEKA